MTTKLLVHDLIIPAGTSFECVDGVKREFVSGNYEALIAMGADYTISVVMDEELLEGLAREPIEVERKYGHVTGHSPDSPHLECFLDGRKVYPIECNDEEGWVRVILRSPDTHPVFPVEYMKFCGEVVIRPAIEPFELGYILVRLGDEYIWQLKEEAHEV